MTVFTPAVAFAIGALGKPARDGHHDPCYKLMATSHKMKDEPGTAIVRCFGQGHAGHVPRQGSPISALRVASAPSAFVVLLLVLILETASVRASAASALPAPAAAAAPLPVPCLGMPPAAVAGSGRRRSGGPPPVEMARSDPRRDAAPS